MKVAIVGSRNITAINVADYVSRDDEIVSGGAVGVDCCGRCAGHLPDVAAAGAQKAEGSLI